jgi:hypothetical protein
VQKDIGELSITILCAQSQSAIAGAILGQYVMCRVQPPPSSSNMEDFPNDPENGIGKTNALLCPLASGN